jgi:OmcA/MtrC family decaheme c-type cytochrome
MFFGCADDGATGATGATGPPGPGGGPGPGVLASETCVVCHGQGQFVDVRTMHRLNTDGSLIQGGTITSAITDVEFTPGADNIITAVTFTFAAFNQAGLNITSNIDLTTNNGTRYSYARFTIAKLVPGQVYATGAQDPNEWYDYANGQRVLPRLVNNGGGSYTYTFVDNTVSISGGLVGAANAYLDNATTRVAIQISGLPVALFTSDPLLSAPVANTILDVVSDAGVGTVSTAVRRDIVTTAACNGCHDPLALHGGGRRDTRICVTCHNSTLPPDGVFVRLVHKIHSSDNNIVIGTETITEFGEVTFPQDRRNCITCHKGLDGDNWRARPSQEACATCHLISFVFPTPAGLTLHSGGVQADNAGCATCHPATGIGAGTSVTRAHTTENQTPNNPYDPPGMVTFQYFIDTVTVDNNAPVVSFRLRSATADNNGVLGPFTDFTLPTDNTGRVTQPAGFSGSPSFLVAYALPQDGVTSPVDYNNLGKAAGQPASASIVGLTVSGTAALYTATLTNTAAAFPPGALMRAVALQGYFTQLNANLDNSGPLDNVGRHTPAVIRAVTSDAVRRVIVKSGYNATTGAPEGCLECHEIFEGHGGNRVNNVQVCVVCHNVNNTSSGRTIPVDATPINPAITGLIPLGSTTPLGSNPLLYPEVANNFKELIHGIHSFATPGKAIPFVDIRNRTTGGFRGVLVYGPEITYPGNLRHCTKCHYANTVPAGSGGTTQSYKVELPASVLPTTQKITTGNPAETAADINAARAAVPNQTDLVNTPISSACYYCHTSDVRADHFRLQGGMIATQRSTVDLTAAPLFLMPDVLATP